MVDRSGGVESLEPGTPDMEGQLATDYMGNEKLRQVPGGSAPWRTVSSLCASDNQGRTGGSIFYLRKPHKSKLRVFLRTAWGYGTILAFTIREEEPHAG